MIWAKEETLPRDELEALQLRKLKRPFLTSMQGYLLIEKNGKIRSQTGRYSYIG